MSEAIRARFEAILKRKGILAKYKAELARMIEESGGGLSEERAWKLVAATEGFREHLRAAEGKTTGSGARGRKASTPKESVQTQNTHTPSGVRSKRGELVSKETFGQMSQSLCDALLWALDHLFIDVRPEEAPSARAWSFLKLGRKDYTIFTRGPLLNKITPETETHSEHDSTKKIIRSIDALRAIRERVSKADTQGA